MSSVLRKYPNLIHPIDGLTCPGIAYLHRFSDLSWKASLKNWMAYLRKPSHPSRLAFMLFSHCHRSNKLLWLLHTHPPSLPYSSLACLLLWLHRSLGYWSPSVGSLLKRLRLLYRNLGLCTLGDRRRISMLTTCFQTKPCVIEFGADCNQHLSGLYARCREASMSISAWQKDSGQGYYGRVAISWHR